MDKKIGSGIVTPKLSIELTFSDDGDMGDDVSLSEIADLEKKEKDDITSSLHTEESDEDV